MKLILAILLYSFIFYLFIISPIERRIAIIEEKSGKLLYRKKKKDEEYNQEIDGMEVVETSHPTFENVYYYVSFAPDVFLFYLFPNTFKNVEEAGNYYLDFCKRAKELNEDEELCNPKWYFEGSINIDWISGNRHYWNRTEKEQNHTILFKLFTPLNIVNNELKQEIQKIYDDNLEHLQNINFFPSNEKDIDYIGMYPMQNVIISLFELHFCGYNEHGLLDNNNTYYMPISSILELLRINKVYSLNKKERKELLKKYIFWNRKRNYKCKINFDKNSAVLKNNFVVVNLSCEYGYNPFYDDIYGKKIKNIDF